MTLLHQAAQKAVEALTLVTTSETFYRDPRGDRAGPAIDALVSALQQQPEPVAPNEWAAEAATVMAQFIHLSAQPERDAWAQNASRAIRLLNAPALQHQEEPSTAVIPPAPPECETEDEKTAFAFGYWQGLHAARKGQEEPREPVADDARKAFEDAVFNRRFRASIKRNPNPPKGFGGLDFVSMNCPTQAELCRRDVAGDYEDETVSAMWWGWRKALAASPSTTRQQEVGSGWRPIESAPKDGSEMLLSNGQIVAQGWWEHQEPYVREHRDMDGRYIDQDEHDGYDGWLDFAGGMLPEPTHWMPLPAAPSTPEKAGGVSDGVGGRTS